MKRIAFIAFIVFWATVGTLFVQSMLQPSARPDASAQNIDGLARTITGAELAVHGRETDCWIAVAGEVYDITTYLPQHPAGESVILPWCGRNATRAFDDLGGGRSHSKRARRLLDAYLVGTLRD